MTKTERMILSNQYEILKHLDPSNAKTYDLAIEALRDGYEASYDEHAPYIASDAEVLSTDECVEVMKIMSMYQHLKRSYDSLKDKADIKPHQVEFQGFDGNNETKHMGYARFLKKEDKYGDLDGGRDRFNSHTESLPMYRRMLSVHKAVAKSGENLTADEIKKILDAQRWDWKPA